MVDLMPVRSSNVEAMGYDGETARLVIAYAAGGQYAYAEVPADVWTGLLTCHLAGQSIGRYLHQHVKGVYAYTRLPRDTE